MTKHELEQQCVIAQDWYEYDPDYWNPMPDCFTSYHLSLAGLATFAKRLATHNETYGFITFEKDGDPYEVSTDPDRYNQVAATGLFIVR